MKEGDTLPWECYSFTFITWGVRESSAGGSPVSFWETTLPCDRGGHGGVKISKRMVHQSSWLAATPHAHTLTLTHTSLGPVPLTPALQEALGARATYASDVDVTGTVFAFFSSPSSSPLIYDFLALSPFRHVFR